MAKMKDSELKALLQAERGASLGGTLTSDLASERSKALDYYNGEMEDMPAFEGRSAAVSTDVSDTIEGLMPGLMEIFAAGEEVVRFEPVGPEDEEGAKQETDYVNHVFMQKNTGFLVLYTFIKDALLSKNGVVKVFWDKSETETKETYLDQPDDAFMMLASAPDAEIVEHTEHADEATGQPLHDVTLVKRKNYGCVRVDPVPPEEFGISKFAKSIKDATYCFHQVKKTEADLIAQGFDEAQVKKLPTYTARNEEEDNARNILKEDQSTSDKMNRSARLIDTIEHYVLMDYDGKDEPGLYRVTTGGGQLEVLKRDGKSDVVAVDEIPFATMTPVIMTHRFFGKSIADLVMDIQRIKTALIRGWLDNVYLINNQRLEVAESMSHERTLDDLLVNRPGAVVRVKVPGAVTPIPNQPIGDTLLPAIEYMDATREWRTGVTRQGQGLDPNSLQNQTATAANQMFTAAQARMKLIARVFAETGIRDLFSLVHGCIRKNDRQINTVRLRNRWVQIDPRNWKTRDDMTINVGLGTGSRVEQVANLNNLLNIQKEIVLSGPTQTLVAPKNIYNTLEKLIERVGLKTIEPYFTDPETVQAPPPPPDPKMVEIQLKAEIEKLQAQADVAVQDRKIASEIALAEKKFALDKELKLIDAGIKQQQAQNEMHFRAEDHQMQREQRTQDHHMKQEERQAKAAEKQAPKAEIQVKHGADEITGPLAEVVDRLGSHMADQSKQQAEMLLAAISSKPKKRKIKGPSGKVYEMTEE
jgi:hypothetical protein